MGGGKLVRRLEVEQSRSQDDQGAGWHAGVRVERDPATGRREAWWRGLEIRREQGAWDSAQGTGCSHVCGALNADPRGLDTDH